MNLRLIAAFLIAPLVLAQYSPPSGGGGGGAVSSVFGRTGTVAAATGDYTAAQVTGAVAGASNLSIAGCVSYRVSAGTLTCVSGFTWDGTSLNVPGPIVIPGAGTGGIDLAYGAAPTAPASGKATIFLDASKHLSTIDSSSNIVDYTPGAGSSGALVLLEQHTASASASLDFTTCISSTYDEYQIELVNVYPGTTGQTTRMRMSVNGGSTYPTSTYNWASFRASSAGSATAGSVSDSSIDLSGGGPQATTASAGGVTGTFKLFSPAAGATISVRVMGQSATYDGTAAPWVNAVVNGIYGSAAPVNAFQVFFSSGTVASGTIRCYGIAK
jgi:hypothetical protein